MFDLIIIGGGAAGFFSALVAKENQPDAKILLLEKTAVLLSKVRISGGGRCNVTSGVLEPKSLVQNYPRGNKELLGPFHTFNSKHTIEWFESRGVKLKKEMDGRMFPVTDSSETIISCLQNEAKRLGVEIRTKQRVAEIKKEKGFILYLQDETVLHTKNLLLATGSSIDGYNWAKELGHSIEKPIPSLFTFNVPESSLKELSGISVPAAKLTLRGTSFEQTGPLLITHFGFSGPAVIKLSAFAAPYLFEKNYKCDLVIDWLPDFTRGETKAHLIEEKAKHPNTILSASSLFSFPKNLKKALLGDLGEKKLSELSNKVIESLAEKLHADIYPIDGKTTHKQEFVTCGGISLKEVNFQTMESKLCPHLYFTGEILNIDGITGGFNFQNAWTTGYIFGKHYKT